jgi:epoxyqueuosine reductase
MGLKEVIIATAERLGFIAAGCVSIRGLNERDDFFHRWLAAGRAAGMGWLARDPARRLDPRLIDQRLRSVITLAYPYRAPAPPVLDWQAELRGRVAAYAIGPDYHDIVLVKAREVAAAVREFYPHALIRPYVDTGPVLEREWASAARIGWFGRNTNLINRYYGSYFFLAELLTDLELEGPAEPYRDHCGTCRRCLQDCPTGALADGLLLDANLCISYLTIEHRGTIPIALRRRMGNWIFGCDVCQEVCPWNGDAHRAAPVEPALTPALGELMELDDAAFRGRFAKTAITRTKRRGLLRNAAIALGNSHNPAATPILARVMTDEPEAIIRAHAAWALGELPDNGARRVLDQAWAREQSVEVRAEIARVLDQPLA